MSQETPLRELDVILAQLRHAYQQLRTEPERNWSIEARRSFADGLLAPQIQKLERLALLPVASAPSTPPNRPRVHGNGFIQLDLTPSKRLHVWGHPEIPRQRVSSQHHDHKFAFRSRVLKGAITNLLYEAVPDEQGDYMTHVARVNVGEDTRLHPTGERVSMRLIDRRTYRTGDTYEMAVGEIHETFVEEPTVTVIDKTGPTLSQGGPEPRVFVRVGEQPDNEFNRYSLDSETLWRIICDTLSAGPSVAPAPPR